VLRASVAINEPEKWSTKNAGGHLVKRILNVTFSGTIAWIASSELTSAADKLPAQLNIVMLFADNADAPISFDQFNLPLLRSAPEEE
jgi:hypothetical protein